MNIINLNGGLGNQLFQYSFGISMKYKFGYDVKFCNEFINSSQLNIKDIFDIEIPFVKKNDLVNVVGIIQSNHKLRNFILRLYRKIGISDFNNYIIENYKKNFLDLPKLDNKFFYGYWQNYNFFYSNIDFIKNNLKFKDDLNLKIKFKKLYDEFSEVVCIHMRLGDYKSKINQKVFTEIPIDYFNNSISKFKNYFKNPIFILFTNDLSQVDNSLLKSSNIILSSYFDTNSKNDFYLMSYCDGYIFSNSTFSLWAAYLSKNKKVIFTKPDSWFLNQIIEKCNDYYPASWVSLN